MSDDQDKYEDMKRRWGHLKPQDLHKLERKGIILSFLQKVIKICNDTLNKKPCWKCMLWLKESPLELEGDCIKRRFDDLSDEQLTAFIEKVEGGG